MSGTCVKLVIDLFATRKFNVDLVKECAIVSHVGIVRAGYLRNIM